VTCNIAGVVQASEETGAASQVLSAASELSCQRLRFERGAASRFEQGAAAALKKLKAGWQDYRYEYDVKIVQPGLSRRAVGEEGLHLLAGAETYLLETRAMPLRIIASE
jgi:hypothetical protein